MILTGGGFLGDLHLHSHAEILPPTEPVRPPLAPFPLHEGVEKLHELPGPLLQAADGHRGSLALPVEQSLIHLDLHRAVPRRLAATVHALSGRVGFLEEISGTLLVGEALAVDATLASQSAHRHRHIQLRGLLQLLGGSIGLTLVVVGLIRPTCNLLAGLNVVLALERGPPDMEETEEQEEQGELEAQEEPEEQAAQEAQEAVVALEGLVVCGYTTRQL
ncbi:unnamed protein product [Closterium sp. NIES-53]